MMIFAFWGRQNRGDISIQWLQSQKLKITSVCLVWWRISCSRAFQGSQIGQIGGYFILLSCSPLLWRRFQLDQRFFTDFCWLTTSENWTWVDFTRIRSEAELNLSETTRAIICDTCDTCHPLKCLPDRFGEEGFVQTAPGWWKCVSWLALPKAEHGGIGRFVLILENYIGTLWKLPPGIFTHLFGAYSME